MREFVVNEYITLKLEGGLTNIYVKDKQFNQCKQLVLDIPVDKIRKYDKIESIDEVANILSTQELKKEIIIAPEQEFWGHCSNLQAWVENNYDTRILHSNLAFPLLKKLVDVGEPKAKRVFKEEIAKRFLMGNATVTRYLIHENYLDYFNREELNAILSQINPETSSNHYEGMLSLIVKLVQLGDCQAKKMFKQVIGNAVNNDNEKICSYVATHGYFKYFGQADLKSMLFKFGINGLTKFSDLFFHLLEELTKAGDTEAERIFKELIIKALKSDNLLAITYIARLKYLKYLNLAELQAVLTEIDFDGLYWIPYIKLFLLDKFTNLGLLEAKKMLRDEIIKETDSTSYKAPDYLYPYLKHLSSEEIDYLVDKYPEDHGLLHSTFMNCKLKANRTVKQIKTDYITYHGLKANTTIILKMRGIFLSDELTLKDFMYDPKIDNLKIYHFENINDYLDKETIFLLTSVSKDLNIDKNIIPITADLYRKVRKETNIKTDNATILAFCLLFTINKEFRHRRIWQRFVKAFNKFGQEISTKLKVDDGVEILGKTGSFYKVKLKEEFQLLKVEEEDYEPFEKLVYYLKKLNERYPYALYSL